MRTFLRLLLLGLPSGFLAAQNSSSESAAPLVAVAPAILQKSARLDSIGEKEAAPLPERVQLAVEAGGGAGHRFVERIALDALLREQTLSLSGFAGPTSAIRAGRLLHADWILRLRLRADDLPHPRLEAEVIDALRADLLGSVSAPLPGLPDESWLLQPSDEAVEIARTAAAGALDAARARFASFSGKTTVAPLVFVNRDQSDRLAPLAGLLLAALKTQHPGVRVLGFDCLDGAMDESVLYHAGMTDLDPVDWGRLADAYVWGEFFEEEGVARLEIKLWRDGSEARGLTFRGAPDKLETLARQAAGETLDAAVGARIDASAEARARAARRLLDASIAFAPKPGRPWDDSARNLARQEARLRQFTMAAFFSPENPMLREQVCSLGLSLARDDKTRDVYRRQFWRTFDQFLFGPGGRPNLALLARAGVYQADLPGYAARFERIGRILAEHPLDERTMRQLCDNFTSAALSLPDEPGLAAARKAMEPLLRSHGSRPDAGSLPGARQFVAPSGAVFTAWEKSPAAGLLDSARTGPLVNAPALDAPQVRFSPWQLVPAIGEKPPPSRLLTATVGDDALWLVNFVPADNREALPCSAARLDLNKQELEWLPARISAEVPVSGIWLEDSQVWMSTRGEGLRVLDRTSGRVKVIDQTGGLATADIVALHRGRDGLYIEPAANLYAKDAVVARIDLATGALSQVVPSAGAEFSLLSPALRAAIASFGDEVSTRVKLPSAPAIGFDDFATPPANGARVPESLPSSHRLGPSAGGRFDPANDPAFARHACITGPRDGYWVAGHHSLVWAAGSRRIPVAHWITGCIRSLADDGRHLFVEILRRTSPEGGDPARGCSPSDLRIYVYDHAEGRWLGWLSAPHAGPMHAGPGILAVVSANVTEQPLALINTAGLGGASPRPIVSTRSKTGWTPLLSALWADDAAAADRLLASGARWDVADVRGWHPLQLAAAWSSPVCLDTLLRRGVPGSQPRPTPDPELTKTYAARRDDRETALHAAVLGGRMPAVDRLLSAGADPLAFDPLGNPLQLAVRHGSPAIVARLLSSVTAEKYREPLRLTAEDLGRKDLLPILGGSALAAKPAWRPADPGRRLYEALRPTPPDLEGVRAALADGADPSKFDGSSAPFLQAAARERKFAAFELLLAATKPEALNEVGRGVCLGASVLRELLAAKRSDLARRLFAAGYKPAPPPDDYDSFGFPTLWLAISCGDPELVRTLRAADFRLANPVPSPRMREILGADLSALAGWRPSIPAALQPIPEAVRQRDAELLRALLEPVPFKHADFDVDAFSPRGLAPLYEATEAGWTEGVRLLLNAGAASPLGDRQAGLSLQDAASRHPEIAILLNRRPGSPDNQLAGAEAVAAIVRDERAALSKLPLGPAVLRYRDPWGWNPLHHAARRGSYEFVGRLLSAGAVVDTLTGGGESPLCLAVFGGDTTCVDLLLSLRARPNLRSGAGWLPLHAAALADRADLVKRLLAAGANPDLPAGPDGDTAALAAASVRDGLETLRLLISAGASVSAVDRNGQSVLEAAVLSDSPEKIQLLLDRGARWQKPRTPGYHPMNVAAENGLVGSVRKLQQLGLRSPLALSLAKDDATRAALQGDESPEGRRFRADEEEWPSVLSAPDWRERVAAHLKGGGNINHLSARWKTPLGLALEQKNAELVLFLVAQGADPSVLVADPFPDPSINIASAGFGLRFEPWGKGTAFYGWLMGNRKNDDRTVPADLDDFAAAVVALFWVHERDPRLGAQMLATAERSGLTHTAAWMRVHR